MAALALRAFDVAVVLALAPFALVLCALIAAAVRLDSPGPAIYRSPRVGRRGRTFRMLKFRKMRHACPGLPLTLADDERITPLGAALARTRLDELPQLWNVLRGDMRLVGPRPELPEFVAEHPEAYEEILTVLPGITGPAALEFAGEDRALRAAEDPLAHYRDELMPSKIGIDLSYVRGRSWRWDLAILRRTALVPFRPLAQRLCEPRGASGAVVLLAAALSVIATTGLFAWLA